MPVYHHLIGVRLLRVGARSSLNVRGAYLKVLSDLLGSAGVIVAALVQMRFGWERADPVVSLLIAAFIVPRIWYLMREATDVLMEAAPRHLDVGHVRRIILEGGRVSDPGAAGADVDALPDLPKLVAERE